MGRSESSLDWSMISWLVNWLIDWISDGLNCISLLIGEAAQPRAFTHHLIVKGNTELHGFSYGSNTSALMTKAIFVERLEKLNGSMRVVKTEALHTFFQVDRLIHPTNHNLLLFFRTTVAATMFAAAQTSNCVFSFWCHLCWSATRRSSDQISQEPVLFHNGRSYFGHHQNYQ